MLVTKENLYKVLSDLDSHKTLALDTETTGLRPFHGDCLFSVIISTTKNDYYFNFNEYPNVESLGEEAMIGLRKLLGSREKTWYLHNAKFDMHMLQREGISIGGKILDVWTMERLMENQHFEYNLDAVATRHGKIKLPIVSEYIKNQSLYRNEYHAPSGRDDKIALYSHVPLEIMQPYGEHDARITRSIGDELHDAILTADSMPSIPKIGTLLETESALTKVLFHMEQRGARLDSEYCRVAIEHYNKRITEITNDFQILTGHEFVRGPLVFKEVFKDEEWAYTEKGNPKFDSAELSKFKHPAAKLVLEYADAKKQLEYFQNFLYFIDDKDVIHTTFNQAGTTTGRLSSRDPNLQNLTSDTEECLYPVRKAIVPRDGYSFFMLDYDQIEYRVMLDMAGAHGLIREIIETGLDVHQVTADLAHVSRREAKTVNFLTLYGGGIKKLAHSLGCTENEARQIQRAIFNAAPEIKDFINKVTKTAERRGYIFNCFGRRFQFPDRKMCYKAPNHLIQGTCADIMKTAMVKIHSFLEGKKTRMILTIHDELIFEVPADEEKHIPEIAEIMKSSYKFKQLPLDVSVKYSKKNLAEKQDWQ